MNFQMAAELAADEGIEVESVLVNDDVAVEDSPVDGGPAGNRRDASFVEKIAGALAEPGGDLAAVAAVARRGQRAVAFVRGGADLRARSPAAGQARLSSWATTRSSWASASTASPAGPAARSRRRRSSSVSPMDADPRRHAADSGDSARVRQRHGRDPARSSCTWCSPRSAKILAAKGVNVARTLVGDYVTSLDMAGCSITLHQARRRAHPAVGRPGRTPRRYDGAPRVGRGRGGRSRGGFRVRSELGRGDRVGSIEDQRDFLTQLDSAIGDADHGVNMSRGFTAVTAKLAEGAATGLAPGPLLVLVGSTLVSTVGGASGPLYGTAFRRAGKALGDAAQVDPEAFGGALRAALEGIQQLGAASEGDKTMVDALAPAVAAYESSVKRRSLVRGCRAATPHEAAEEGVAATVPLQARKGRASYLGPRSVGHQDPGATSTALILAALERVAKAG